MNKIKIGISSCLLGNEVRFDGQHKHDRFITGTLGKWCEFVPVCPEVECGLSIPRESMRLVGTKDSFRLITNKTREDITPRMLSWAEKRLDELETEDLVAFIFKTKSPSSGLRAVKIYKEDGNVAYRNGRGLFTGLFTERFPHIPVEDEGRLHDPGIRENFIEKIFILERWKESVRGGAESALVDFHARHKYTLMAHSPQKLKELGKITASVGNSDYTAARDKYLDILLGALDNKKTVSKNTNVLQHIMGYFKKNLDSDEKAELAEIIGRYKSGYVPLIVPVTLLNHFVRKYDQPYLKNQYYLNPHPFEIGLLNHV
ncbi:MAG: DUF523 and DUF1722 domain-containing protein [Spirochaetales bacterium]|uniref:DUF523 and DUF1722 domain-containing protein n=1 Tax=Candidatus Thalassospirochaeta sargassi TaxID=3119039 RepID=A0AAJ1IFU1_9SPIO|nr:DUF523 and DUF1722 domain-containing protein [Spirochaetales bacterium]